MTVAASALILSTNADDTIAAPAVAIAVWPGVKCFLVWPKSFSCFAEPVRGALPVRLADWMCKIQNWARSGREVDFREHQVPRQLVNERNCDRTDLLMTRQISRHIRLKASGTLTYHLVSVLGTRPPSQTVRMVNRNPVFLLQVFSSKNMKTYNGNKSR